MKLIKDLGIKDFKTYRRRTGIYECPICKKHFEAITENVVNNLSTKCRSCASSNSNKKHSLSNTKIHHTWRHIKDRCLNEKNASFKNYGGRGITLCEEWKNDFMSFYTWAINSGYKEGLTIDRINNDGNYEPSNCRWATHSVQASNRRKKPNCSTAFVGIVKHRGKFVANVQFEKKSNFIGNFETIEEAIQKRNDFIFDKNLPNHINTLKDTECAV